MLLFRYVASEHIGKLICFALAAGYVCYRLYENPVYLNNIYLTVRADVFFWSLPAIVVVWAFISTFWSPFPIYTLASAGAFSITLLIGLYLGSKYNLIELISLLGVSLSLTMVASLALCIVFPDVAIMSYPAFDLLHDGRWRGVYSHKNWLGLYAGLACTILAGICLLRRDIKLPALAVVIVLLVLAAFLLYKSESTSALIGITICSVFLGISVFRGSIKKSRINSVVVVILLLPFSYSAISELGYRTSGSEDVVTTHGFTRTSTFSGRVPHWQYILHESKQQSLIGFGYKAFWRSDYADPIDSQNQWVAVQAHSGWIEAVLDLGVPVAVLAIGWMIIIAYRCLYRCIYFQEAEPTIIFTLILFMFIANTSESLLPGNSGLLMMIFVALCSYRVNNKVNVKDE